jgi:hypothetical protein
VGGIVAVVVIFIVALIIISASKKKGSGGAFDQAVYKGTPARGILLWVAPRGTPSGTAARRFQLRQVKIDIEIPGQPPYVIDTMATIPMNLVRDVLPGATMEVRVDRSDPTSVTIVGPGAGFSPMALLAAVSTPPGGNQ